MDPTALNNQFNQFIGAVQDDNRIVVRAEAGRESFEIRSPSARLNDDIYTTSPTVVAERIRTFCQGNGNRINQEKFRELCVVVQRKLTEVNSKRSGFINCIILLFNRSLRARLNNEFQFLSPLNTNLQDLLRNPAWINSSDPLPQANPSGPNTAPASNTVSQRPAIISQPVNNSSSHSPQPEPQTIPLLSPQQNNIPTPTLAPQVDHQVGPTPPPPPPPPPPPLSSPQIESLFSPSFERLPNEPEAPFIPKTGTLTSEQIQRGKDYITDLRTLLVSFKKDAEQLGRMEETIQPVRTAIADLNKEIIQYQQMITYLENDTNDDFIPVSFPFQNSMTGKKGIIQVPILTAKAYRDYCEAPEVGVESNSADILSSSGSEAQKPSSHQTHLPLSQSEDSVRDNNLRRGPFGSNHSQSIDTPPGKPVAKKPTGVAAIRQRFQPAQSSPNLTIPPPRSPASTPSWKPQTTPKRPDFDILNVPFIVEMQRAGIAACQEQLEHLQSEIEQLEREYQTFQRGLIPNIRTIVAQKETYLSSCQRILTNREQNLGRGVARKAPTASSSQPTIEEIVTTGRTKREILTARYQQHITAQEDSMSLEMILRTTVKGKQKQAIIKGFKKSFFGLISIP